MRGFPLVNFFLVLCVLGLGGLVLRHLTQAPVESHQTAPPSVAAAAAGNVATRVTVLLSAQAKRVELTTLDGTVLIAKQPQETLFNENLELPLGTSGMLLRVVWSDGTSGHRFAKVVLEPRRLPTLEHVFDARGDLDDLWEFPPLTLPSL